MAQHRCMTVFSRSFFRSSARFLITALAVCSAHQASAHAFWLEASESKNLIARFGEGDEYEESPGRLDNFTPPAVISAPKLEVEKKKDHFLIRDSKISQPVVLTSTYTVRTKPEKDGVPASASLPVFYARWHVAGVAAEPAATLDIVPSKEPGKATVYFQGKPLAGAKLRLKPAAGETVKLESDAAGVVSFTATGSGLYTLQLNHPEKAAGKHLDVAYDTVSHNATLTWLQP